MIEIVIEYIEIWTLVIIIEFKYFGLWYEPNKLLLLMDRIVTFGIRVNNQSEMWYHSQ